MRDMTNIKFGGGRRNPSAFGRTDLVVVIGVVGALGLGLFAFAARSRTATIAVCTANLKQLSAAMAVYENDNAGRMPYAYLEFGSYKDYKTSRTVWDSLIFPYVPPGPNGLAQKHLLRCPADTIPAVQASARRTYAMPNHSNKGDNWPLSAENATGVGVWYSRWEKRSDLTNYISMATTKDADGGNAAVTVTMPALKLDMIPSPASTLLLTEHATPDNTAFNFHGATIDSERDHVATNLDINLYHGGKINYLMVDGQVEFLYPMESIGQADPRDNNSGFDHPNVWVINH